MPLTSSCTYNAADFLIRLGRDTGARFPSSGLNDLFYSEEGKKIVIKVNRLGVIMNFTFTLKKII